MESQTRREYLNFIYCNIIHELIATPPRSAYSLSGHVSIIVTSPYSLFERRRTARLLLQSVLLTFEGQTEIITPQTGYAPLRLCSITREIALDDPVEMSNEGHEESAESCKAFPLCCVF